VVGDLVGLLAGEPAPLGVLVELEPLDELVKSHLPVLGDAAA
jgi:hypothetical protein